MRTAVISTMLLGMLTGVALASDPCCAVISFNAGKGQALVRNTKTGRTFLLKGANFRAGTTLATLPAALFEPASIEPCCSVASIQKVGRGALVGVTNKTTGATVYFEVDEQEEEEPVGAMKIGQAVQLVGKFAIFSVPVSSVRLSAASRNLQVRTLAGAASTQVFYSYQLKP